MTITALTGMETPEKMSNFGIRISDLGNRLKWAGPRNPQSEIRNLLPFLSRRLVLRLGL